MNAEKIITAIIALSLVAGFAIAQEKDSDKAEDILFNARRFTKRASLKAIDPIFTLKPEKIVLYRMTTQAGDLLEKYEKVINNKKYHFIFRNRETIIRQEDANVAIIFPFPLFPRTARPDWYLNMPQFYKQNTEGTYSLSTESFNGIPCYKVLVKYPTDDATIAKIQQITLEQLRQYRQDCENRYMSVMTFVIGKEKPFIYSCVFYNMKGKILHSMQWGKLDFEVAITPSYFELPRGVTIENARDHDELKVLSRKYYNAPEIK